MLSIRQVLAAPGSKSAAKFLPDISTLIRNNWKLGIVGLGMVKMIPSSQVELISLATSNI